CGLPAPAVAAGFIARFQSGIEFLGELIVRTVESLPHCLDNVRSDQNVSLRGPRRALAMAFPVLGAVSGEDCDVALGVDDRDLPSALAGQRVLGEEPVLHLLRIEALPEKVQSLRSITDVHIRLRGYSADVGVGPGNHRADREVS